MSTRDSVPLKPKDRKKETSQPSFPKQKITTHAENIKPQELNK